MFFNTVILLVLILLLYSISTSWYKKEDTSCPNLAPGLDKLLYGYDVTTMDPLPYAEGNRTSDSQSTTTNVTRRIPLLQFTCAQGKTWTSMSGIRYQIPDQVVFNASYNASWADSESNVAILKSSDDIRSWMAGRIGVERTVSNFSFSNSPSYMTLQNIITNSSRFVVEATSSVSTASVELVPSLEFGIDLSRFAETYAERSLNGTFETNREAYERFIEEFGTHYLSSAILGGVIRTHMETAKQHVYSQSEEEITEDSMSAHNNSISPESTAVSNSFLESTDVSSVIYYGGDTCLLSTNGSRRRDEWLPTIEDGPWLVSGQLKPVSDLISDKTKAANLLKAINDRIMRGYLEELSREVAGARMKVDDPFITDLNNTIVSMKENETLVASDVETLRNDVIYNLIVPSWFRTNTKLCFLWYPDGRDHSQCGPQWVPRTLCSATNSKTRYYRDDTDRGNGGCVLRWGITSLGHPAWFDFVQICYRWWADGRKGQCGGSAHSVFCAPVNAYTGGYRDDMDRRSGGCQMSWSLRVDPEAPLWMRTSSLCYYWYPDGDPGQCGGAGVGSRTLCARSNQWTRNYRDDSDRRGGGCMMSWGLMAEL